MRNLFLDIDDTYLSTETFLRASFGCYGVKCPKLDTVYSIKEMYGDDSVVSDLYDYLMSNYAIIPKRRGASDGIKLLSSEYNVIFCSAAYSEEEKNAKKRFAMQEGYELILSTSKDVAAKYGKDSIIVDDKLVNLFNSGVSPANRILMWNKYFSFHSSNRALQRTFSYMFIKDWFDLVELLVGGNTDEKLRELVRSRVQGFSGTVVM